MAKAHHIILMCNIYIESHNASMIYIYIYIYINQLSLIVYVYLTSLNFSNRFLLK